GVRELWRDIRPIEWSVIIGAAVAGRCLVTQIEPRFDGTITHVVWNLLIGRAPCQPHRVHRHTGANCSLAHERLGCWREALIHFRMMRNARLNSCTTHENQRPGCYTECQREEQNSTLHSATIIRLSYIESIDASG